MSICDHEFTSGFFRLMTLLKMDLLRDSFIFLFSVNRIIIVAMRGVGGSWSLVSDEERQVGDGSDGDGDVVVNLGENGWSDDVRGCDE